MGNMSEAIRVEFKCLLLAYTWNHASLSECGPSCCRATDLLSCHAPCSCCAFCRREMLQGTASPRAVAADVAQGETQAPFGLQGRWSLRQLTGPG